MSSAFVSRAGALVGATLLVIVVGCVTSPGRRAPLVEQKGEVTLANGAEKDVHFPATFAAAPDIDAQDDWMNEFKIVERKPDHFRIRNNTDQIIHVSWTARGERPAPAE